MAKRSHAMERAHRLEVRGRVLRGMARVFFAVLGLSAGFVVVATGVPQKRKLDELEAKLAQTQAREAEVVAEKDACATENQALKTDREFLEIHSRDRLDYYKEGEKVFKFHYDR